MEKKDFVKIIESIKDQVDHDKEKALLLTSYTDNEATPYDNSRLLNTLFSILHKHFPPTGGCCEIQRFCFELDFGRVTTPELTINDLWTQINKT